MSGEKTHYFRLGVTLCPFSLFLSPSSRLYFTLSVSVYLSICVFYSFLYISPAYLFFSQLFPSVFELEFAISLARWNPNCSYLFPRLGSLTGTEEEDRGEQKNLSKVSEMALRCAFWSFQTTEIYFMNRVSYRLVGIKCWVKLHLQLTIHACVYPLIDRLKASNSIA